jgi:hypothetical protein
MIIIDVLGNEQEISTEKTCGPTKQDRQTLVKELELQLQIIKYESNDVPFPFIPTECY